ncbi:MAG: hypothetical protein U0T74_05665 [Chitinophagales bacterium]
MTYLLEIDETKESKSLLEHLRTLKYVRLKQAGRNFKTEDEIISEIRKSEKSGKIKWADAKKQIAQWK